MILKKPMVNSRKFSDKSRDGSEPGTAKVLLIGYGSIGRKHVKHLADLGIKPFVLTDYPDDADAFFIQDVKELNGICPEYCVIASPTARHMDDFIRCIGFQNRPKRVLIEKPLECTIEKALKIKKLAEDLKIETYVAYNLRFHDAFDHIRKYVESNDCKIIHAVVGQDLTEWRPYKDYRLSYSASREMGGGVDLDLSHELDYLLWIFGKNFSNKFVFRDKISSLEIDSNDICKILLGYKGFLVDITLDYIRKPAERYLDIYCEKGGKLSFDFISNKLQLDGKQLEVDGKTNHTYLKMLKAFLFGKDKEKLCTIDDALRVLEVLDA